MKSNSVFSKSAQSVLAAAFMLAGVFLSSHPANGQQMSLIRDTETENVIRSYLDPLLYAAGLNPYAVQVHIVNDPAINAFVSGGQHMFVHTGLITNLESANQLIGVLAHETGHIAGGHLIRTREGARAASVPMILSMAAGLAVALAGLPELRHLKLWGAEGIGDAAVPFFLAMQNLEILELPETSITAEGLSQLSQKKKLKQLFVGGIDLEPAQIDAIREALPDCRVSWWEKPTIEFSDPTQRRSD